MLGDEPAPHYISDLHGLVMEHLEKVLLSGSQSRLIKSLRRKLIKSLLKELQQSPDESMTSRLADFYIMFQRRGGEAGVGEQGSQQLRTSFRRRSRGCGSTDSLGSVDSRISRSSETVETNQTTQTKNSNSTEISFNVSLSTPGEAHEDGSDASVDLSDDVGELSSEQPLAAPLAKTMTRASVRGGASGDASSTTSSLKPSDDLADLRSHPDSRPLSPHAMQAPHHVDAAVQTVQIDSAWRTCSPAPSESSHAQRPPRMPGTPTSPTPSDCSRKSDRSRRHKQRSGAITLTSVPTLSSFISTPPASIRCSLEWIMKHWNPVKLNSCCPFHAFCAIAKLCIHHLIKEECIPLWSPLTGWQCNECFCLNHGESGQCDLCLEPRPIRDNGGTHSGQTSNDSLTTPSSGPPTIASEFQAALRP